MAEVGIIVCEVWREITAASVALYIDGEVRTIIYGEGPYLDPTLTVSGEARTTVNAEGEVVDV